MAGLSPLLRSIALNAVLLMPVSSAFSAGAAPEDGRLSEPVVGFLVDPGVIKFDPVPKDQLEPMGFHADDRVWVMAEYDDSRVSGKTYYVVSGLVHPEMDTDPPGEDKTMTDAASYVMTRDKGGYKILGYAESYAVGKDTYGIPPRVLEKLAQDSWDRLLKAFGNKDAMLKEFIKESAGQKEPDPVDPYIYKILKANGFTGICLEADDPADVAHCVKQQ